MNTPFSIFLVPVVFSLAAYIQTASTSIAGGDSGELVAEGCTLGTSHPPGYPLYTIIVYVVASFGKKFATDYSPAYLVNISSCVFGSVASGLISLSVFHFNDEAIFCGHNEIQNKSRKESNQGLRSALQKFSRCSSAISSGLMCSFSPLMWQYNISAEVFALHNLFVASIVYALTQFCVRPDPVPTSAAGALLCGLALTNQHTSVLLVLPISVWVVFKTSMVFKPKLLMKTTISFIAGLSPYTVLPLFALKYPHAGSWGNTTTFSGFFHHLLRRDYGTLQLYSGKNVGSEGVLERTLRWMNDLLNEQLCHPLLGGFLLIGIASVMNPKIQGTLKKKNSKPKNGIKTNYINHAAEAKLLIEAQRMIIISLFFYLVVFHGLSNLPLSNPLFYGIHQRFWMHPNILSFVMIGVGMHRFVVYSSKLSSLLGKLIALAILCLPLFAHKQNYSISDQSDTMHFRNYALSILDTLPMNSLFIINYDQQWTSIRYMQECEGVRPDITSVNLSMMSYLWWESKRFLYDKIVFPGTHYTRGNTIPWINGGFTFSEFINANVNQYNENIFIGGKLNYDDPQYDEKYEEIPHGLVRRIVNRSLSNEERSKIGYSEHYRLDSLAWWRVVSGYLSANLPSKSKYSEKTWERTIRIEFFDHLTSRATYLLDVAVKEKETFEKGQNKTRVLSSIVEAAAWLEMAISWDDVNPPPPEMRKNLGLAYMNMVRSDEGGGFPFFEDIFHAGGDNNDPNQDHRHNWWTHKNQEGVKNWKQWATLRWKEEWGSFLELDSSRAVPGYDQVKIVYDAVLNRASMKT